MRTRRGATAKRAFDVLCALTLLVLLSPVLALAALAVKCSSVGPVLFRQVRVGRGGRTFQILKLRTMCVDAERRGLGLSVAARDERLTGAGRLLRVTSIDELPQLVNVLRGDMSIVGPRPTVPAQVDRYTAFQRRRLEVRPRITGLAQISGRNALP